MTTKKYKDKHNYTSTIGTCMFDKNDNDSLKSKLNQSSLFFKWCNYLGSEQFKKEP